MATSKECVFPCCEFKAETHNTRACYICDEEGFHHHMCANEFERWCAVPGKSMHSVCWRCGDVPEQEMAKVMQTFLAKNGGEGDDSPHPSPSETDDSEKDDSEKDDSEKDDSEKDDSEKDDSEKDDSEKDDSEKDNSEDEVVGAAARISTGGDPEAHKAQNGVKKRVYAQECSLPYEEDDEESSGEEDDEESSGDEDKTAGRVKAAGDDSDDDSDLFGEGTHAPPATLHMPATGATHPRGEVPTTTPATGEVPTTTPATGEVPTTTPATGEVPTATPATGAPMAAPETPATTGSRNSSTPPVLRSHRNTSSTWAAVEPGARLWLKRTAARAPERCTLVWKADGTTNAISCAFDAGASTRIYTTAAWVSNFNNPPSKVIPAADDVDPLQRAVYPVMAPG
jgi:hypothetical protein